MSMYRTANNSYGTQWASTDQKKPPTQVDVKVPKYQEVADGQRQLYSGLKKLKAQTAAQFATEDSYVFDPAMGGSLNRPFPVTSEEIRYPPNQIKGNENPMYISANREYGRLQPAAFDMSNKFHPRNEIFTHTFVGGRVPDTGLNCSKTPSRVHSNYDQ